MTTSVPKDQRWRRSRFYLLGRLGEMASKAHPGISVEENLLHHGASFSGVDRQLERFSRGLSLVPACASGTRCGWLHIALWLPSQANTRAGEETEREGERSS